MIFFLRLLILLLVLPGALGAEKVTLQLKWKHQFQFAGYYAALEQGYYRAAGLDVNIVEAAEEVPTELPVMTGMAQFGIGASELVYLRAQGKPVVVIATIFQHSPLVLLTGKNVRSVQDLAGKRIMLLPEEAELFVFLQRSGVPRSNIIAVPHNSDAMQLVTGKVDAISGYSSDEPGKFQAARFPFLQFSPRSVGIDFYGDSLFTTEEYARKHPAQVSAFRDASIRGWQYALDHQDEMIDLIIARYAKDASRQQLAFEAAEIRRLIQPELIPIGLINPKRWQKIADTYTEAGMMTGRKSLKGFIYEPEIESALPSWINFSLFVALTLIGFFVWLAWRLTRLNEELQQTLTDRDKALREGRESEEQLRVILDIAPVAIITWKENHIVTSWNRAAQRTFGWDSKQAIGRNFFDFMIPREEQPAITEITKSILETGVIQKSVNYNLTQDGRRILCSWFNTLVEDPSGNALGVISIAMDITEQTDAEAALKATNQLLQNRIDEIQLLQSKLEEQAIRDSLTGLYNRRYLDETLEREVARARREGQPLSLMMIDVDHFKKLNDTYGHRAGDEVLRRMSALLLADIRTEDIACRYGGEEFLVLLPGMPLDKAMIRAENWRRKVADMNVKFGAFSLNITASFGIAAYPEHGHDPDQLTASADEALYRAKHLGRNRIEQSRQDETLTLPDPEI